MRDCTLVRKVEADRERSTESDGRHSDIGGANLRVQCPVVAGDVDQPTDHVLRGGTLVGPVCCVEQRMHDVDHPETGVNSVVHVTAQRLPSVS